MSRHLLEQSKDMLERLLCDSTCDPACIEGLISELQRELDVGRKYKTGNYLILRFDQFGAKIATALSEGVGLTGAQAQAKAEIAEGVCASAVVTMVCWNSKDRTAERWEVK